MLAHGADDGKRQVGLRLDMRDGAIQKLKSGGKAIVPGKFVPAVREFIRLQKGE